MPPEPKSLSKDGFRVGDIHKDVDMPSSVLDEILTTRVPSKAVLICYGCGTFGNPDVKQCTSCQSAYFCNRECLQKSWGRHKQECKGICSHFQEEKTHQKQEVEMANTVMSTYNSNNGGGDEVTCAVCLDQTKIGKFSTLLLPCGHHFCYECITDVQHNALSENQNFGFCPLCRTQIPHLEGLVGRRVLCLLELSEIYELENNKVEQDRACELALQNVAFMVDHQPGHMIFLETRGNVYYRMGKYEEAIVAFKKSYNSTKWCFERALKRGGYVSSDEESRKSMEEYKNHVQSDPSAEFPIDDLKQVEKEILPLIEFDADSLQYFTRVLSSIANCYKFNGDAENAIKLLLLVKKITSSLHPRTMPVVELTKDLAACYVELGQLQLARKMASKNIQVFRYLAGHHKILVDCEKKEGNLDKALFYACKGYFYEEYWNEKIARAKNLKLWNDIRDEIIKQKQEVSKAAAKSEEDP